MSIGLGVFAGLCLGFVFGEIAIVGSRKSGSRLDWYIALVLDSAVILLLLKLVNGPPELLVGILYEFVVAIVSMVLYGEFLIRKW